MICRLRNWFVLLLTAAVVMPLGQVAKAGDIIDLDLTLVDPSVHDVFENAERFWEDRILGYSSEMPGVLTRQLSALQIVAEVSSIDGEGGVLGQAGPTGTLTYWQVARRPYVIPVTAFMQFDLDDFPSLEADGILEDVIIHEMGHALGFGSLWADNQLIVALAGVGQTEYIGAYGLQGYVRDTGNLTSTFVPLEQRGGGGTALAHWNDMPPFFNQIRATPPKKEILTGFACDEDPNYPAGSGILFCAPKFISNASLGAMADLGYAVNGFNGQFALPRGSGLGEPWPKFINGPGPVLNFGNDPAAAALRFRFSHIRAVTRASMGSTGASEEEPQAIKKNDPYGLRDGRWK